MYVQIEEKYEKEEDRRQDDVETLDTHSLGVRYKPQDLPFKQQVLAGTTNKKYSNLFLIYYVCQSYIPGVSAWNLI